ncbi:helix-turn-helix transcriptional regulator [Luteovulum azotoformans]|nr:helix-turn-helix transcriptional regulator [Cereibacter azotoformans]
MEDGVTDDVEHEGEGGGPLPEWAVRIQELTAKAGLPQAELARRAGMSRDAYNRYFRGLTRPPVKQLIVLAELFGVAPTDIDPDRAGLVALEDASHRSYEEMAGGPLWRSQQLYSLSPPSSGDPLKARLRVDADVPLDVAMSIIAMLQKDPKP